MTSQKTLESLRIVGSVVEVCCKETVFQDDGEEFASQLWRTTLSPALDNTDNFATLTKHLDSPESLQRIKDILAVLQG